MANYPTSASSDSNLYVQVNNKTTSLSAGVSDTATTIPVASTSGFPASGTVTVDLEIIAYASLDATNFLSATRGFDGTTAVAHLTNALVSHNIIARHHNVVKDEVIATETDLVSVQSALADLAPASTSTDILTRVRQIVTQIKAITGTANWYDAVAANLTQKASTALSNLASVAINTSLLPGTDNSIDLGSTLKRWVVLFVKDIEAGASGTPGTVDVFPSTAAKGKVQIAAADSTGDTTTTIINASQAGARTYTVPDAGASASFAMTEGTQTINGNKTFGNTVDVNGQLIGKGTTTNDNAAAGDIGEYVEAVVAGINAGATNIWADAGSISLTAGDWDVSGILFNETTSGTTLRVLLGISVTSGNDDTGLVSGSSRVKFGNTTALPTTVSLTIAGLRLSLSTTTTVYLKHFREYTGTATSDGRISARRVR